MTSDGNGLREVEVWSSKVAGTAYQGRWSFGAMQVLAGDANADGRDDLVVGYRNSSSNWVLHVFAGIVVSGQLDFADPVAWTGGIPSDLNLIKLAIGQYDRNPGADVAEFQDFGSCRTRMFMHESLTSGGVPTNQFHPGHEIWDSNNTSGWCWSSSQFYGGYYGGGNSGIVATYDFGGCAMGIYTFSVEWVYDPPQSLLPTPKWFPHIQQWNSGWGTNYWCAGLVEPAIRDITGDGKGDFVAAYLCCGGFQQRTWVFPSVGPPMNYTPPIGGNPPAYWAGTGVFSAAALKEQGGVGPIGIGSVVYDTTSRYQLVAKHSGKCVAIHDGTNGGSTLESASVKQIGCVAGHLNTQFVIEQRGAAYARLHPAHDTAKCINVYGANPNNTTPLIQSTCTPGQSNESWQIEYVSGLSTTPNDPNELAVRLVTNLSGRCLDVTGVSTSDGAQLQQYDCIPGQPNQTFFLRKVTPPNDGLLAHWPIGATSPFNTTIADASGRNAHAYITGLGQGVQQTTSTFVVNPNGYALTGGPVVNTVGNFSVSAWVKLDAVGGTYQTVVAQRGGAYSAFYLRHEPDGRWHFVLLNNINGGAYSISTATSSGNAVAGVWVHLAGVYDAATRQGQIYVNGALSGTTAVPAGVAASGQLIIGSSWSGGGWNDRLTGEIDDVRAWERTLTGTEISQIYATGR